MGKRGERTVKTYGRHRQRVISSDVWNNALGKKEVEKNVFSTSSSMDSLSMSHNSTGDSVFQPRKTKNSNKNKENPQPVQRRRNLRKLDSSGGDSTSSTCSEGIFNSNSRPRRALRDRSNMNEKESKTYGKRKRGQITALHHYSMCNNASASSGPSLYNFSDFDDYSLVISGTPGRVSGKESFQNSPPCHLRSGTKLQIETSTPFAKRFQPGTPLTEEMKDSDLSHIDVVNSPISNQDEDNDSRESQEGSCTDLDKLGISSIVEGSRILTTPPVGQRSNLESSVKSCGSSSGKSPVDDCMVQLVRLRESFLSLHVSTRSSTRGEKNSDIVVDNSKSLFSDISLHTDESSTDDNNEENSEESETSEGEDEIALSDIEEDAEVEEDSDDVDSDENSSIPSKSSHNDSTHYMLAEEVEEYKEVDADDEEEEDLVEDENEELDEEEEEELEEEEEEDQMSNSSYNTAESESQDPSYHTADTTNTTPLRSQVRLRRRVRDKPQDLNESIFDVLTPEKCAQSIIEESPRTKVYQVCQQESHVSFRTCIPDRMMAACTKVGEGVYGEVFRTQNKGKSVAIKVIPIEGSFPVNDEPQKTFGEMLPEIVISRELSSLRLLKESYTPNFCQVNRVSCVQGRYPAKLLKEWKAFDKKCQSQNDKPDVFDDEQLFIVFEFADGGRDLESCQFQNISEAKSALAQVAFSLAVAEETLEFEHRDLHWGNVLVKRTEASEIHYCLMGQDYSIPSHRVETCLIDFTLSRLRKDGCVVYNDLSTDETLFEGSGDLQFDIYRQMKENNGNNWEPFHPRSNILWLHYLADKLVRSKRYVRNSREDKSILREFRNFLKDILDYDSACELVTCNEFLKS
ncbi:Serine/threonine-protein kinase haspin [Mizuhopecten yessoensis]|uniref:non-specific serine/threonine protein kinase n=1 Tax=Mizuhopecten yessoensis TaxID=6573 RepID=A0A210Q2D4_MIZYE|nr:Serine/threonine-protein kinase haspin [Mizuhopecten yessoensis]